MAKQPVVITCAITGSLPQKADNPAVPVTPAEQIESTHAAFEAGATLVHLHVRQDDGRPSSDPERFAEVQDGSTSRRIPLSMPLVFGSSAAAEKRIRSCRNSPDR